MYANDPKTDMLLFVSPHTENDHVRAYTSKDACLYPCGAGRGWVEVHLLCRQENMPIVLTVVCE